MLSVVGLITVLVVVGILISGKVSPIVAMTIIPIIGASIAGFAIADIGEFYLAGLDKVMNVVAMFVFAVIFFGIMRDVGLFNPLVERMIKITKGNIIAVVMATAIIGVITSLDAQAASTFLIAVPALLPLYKKLNMNPYLLILLLAASIGVLNMMPWSGPIVRASAVTGIDATELWRPLITVQIIAIIVLLVMAFILGVMEKRRLDKLGLAGTLEVTGPNEGHEHESLPAPRNFWPNVILTAIVIGVLIWGIIPPAFTFMIAVSIALPLNFRSTKEQSETIKEHAPGALQMAAITLAAGSFLGIVTETGMLDAMAESLAHLLPASVVPNLHLIVGFFGVPLELVTSTDAYYFALLPVVDSIVSPYGVESSTVVHALTIGDNLGTMVSPFAPALWLGLGLAGLEMGKHIKYSLFWLWGFSTVVYLTTIAIGIIPV
ncbi:citrate:proton symporter [Alkalihalobacillus clausii]|uniref:CitMHS family transporter n=1 Tax=Shouchella clausii TaxID=79880 RepID=UPI00203CF662|nr:citrate:proton symporter [Shouchella clausii]MCM3550778.1 citrate:proton symporter [Shouchella clausii]